MKKIFFIITFLIFVFNCNNSVQAGINRFSYRYIDYGGIYTDTNFPIDVSENQNHKNSLNTNLSKLKSGTATSNNILLLVDVGDSSIDTAAKKAGITKIHYVDMNIHKVFIPLLFIPIYVREYKTTVYGE